MSTKQSAISLLTDPRQRDNVSIRATKTKIAIAILGTFLLLLLLPLFAQDWQSLVKKMWQFKAKRGVVKIALLVVAEHPKVSELDILYENEAQPSLAEEVAFIREVLHELPALGVDPRSLSSINMRGFAEPEVTRRVAIAALHSAKWHSFVTTGTGSAEAILQHLLDSTGVYNAFNAALDKYDLRVKTVGAEKVSGAKCLELNIPDLPCSIHHNPRVPTGANLSIVLERTR
jgi:hypothetical protein